MNQIYECAEEIQEENKQEVISYIEIKMEKCSYGK
jgi:hypothetical protein